MKQLLNKLHTPESWKRNLYSEIERTEATHVKSNKSRITMRICMGAVAVCAAFAMVFTMVPKNDNYTLLLSAEEVAAYAEVAFRDMPDVYYDPDTGFDLNDIWYSHPNGMNVEDGDEYGMVDVEIYAQFPVRISGDNIESVTFTPHCKYDNISLSVITPTDDIDELYKMEDENKPSITLTYGEQFDPNKVLAIRWNAKEEGAYYNPATGEYEAAVLNPKTGKPNQHIINGVPVCVTSRPFASETASEGTTVDIQINRKDGSTKTITVSATHEKPDEIGESEKFVFEQVTEE